MTMKQRHQWSIAATLLAIGLAPAAPAAAQVSVEGRVGGAVGNHVPAAAGLETLPGLSLTGLVEYAPVSSASIYAGYSRASFGCEEGFCTDDEVTITTQGFGAGVRVHHGRLPWLRAGALFYDSAISTSGGDHQNDAILGFEVGAGYDIPVYPRLAIVPGIYFRSQPGDDRTTVVGADVGVRFSF